MEVGNIEIWDEMELPKERVKGLECGVAVRSALPSALFEWLDAVYWQRDCVGKVRLPPWMGLGLPIRTIPAPFLPGSQELSILEASA